MGLTLGRASRGGGLWRVAVASLLLATAAFAARTVYVSTRYANLRDGKTSASPILEKLSVGQPLDVVAEEGSFLRVRTAGGRTGYVARGWTGANPPTANGMASQLGAAARSSSAGGVTYTAGARGLADEAQTYAASLGLADSAAAVRRMEQKTASDDEMAQFLQAGKLGEWREVAP